MSRRALALPAVALTAGLVATVVPTAAQANATPFPAASASRRAAPVVYFAAHLTGANEVPTKGGPAVGDRNGDAYVVIRVSGDKISYAARWRNIAAPTAFHIHQGRAGTNGDVKIGFFGEALPGSARAVTGTVKVGDGGLPAALRRNPGGFYANLHTKEFPGGAVRAQFRRLSHPVNPVSLLADGTHAMVRAQADGAQEVPSAGKKVGDPDGHARWSIGVDRARLRYSVVWSRVSAPTNGHIHRGEKGKNGPVVADLFADTDGLPASITGIAGTAPVRPDIAKGILKNSKNWYANLHTTEFGGGAVRGQLCSAHGGR
ncbi:hypothetical protein GCM10017673_10340 [Streptosporangium violaceochromogenes]|nr:hypothetical protein GCM10017673_10340 [Streptosporangium violaceochromogenes]